MTTPIGPKMTSVAFQIPAERTQKSTTTQFSLDRFEKETPVRLAETVGTSPQIRMSPALNWWFDIEPVGAIASTEAIKRDKPAELFGENLEDLLATLGREDFIHLS